VSDASPGSGAPVQPSAADRLDSWKEIAGYLRRDVTTVQRWEKREAMPVHRHLHDRAGSVFAFRSELDAWAKTRSAVLEAAPGAGAQRGAGVEPPDGRPPTEDGAPPVEPGGAAPIPARRGGPAARRRALALSLIVAGAVAAGLTVWWFRAVPPAPSNPLADARFVQLTDFPGVEQAAALSRDGQFVAFLSDRDGPMDVWLTQVGSGRFVNLTRGGAPELVNPSIRTLGFSPDGTLVTFWTRGRGGAGAPDIGIWAGPLLGGDARPYLEGAAEYDWTADGSRLVYHTPGPGDPMFVREGLAPPGAPPIFSAEAGLHAHFPLWSPDRAFIYFVQGTLPDRLDIWRIRPTGGPPERITRHDATVSHPVFLDARTLLYLATDADGFGPWIHAVDVEERAPRRVSSGVDRYTSLAISADGRRIAATAASPQRTLWRVPVTAGRADMAAAQRIPLTTGSGSLPRLGPGWLLYVSSKGTGDGLWKLHGGRAVELWSAPEARIVAAPAIRRDGRRIAFPVRQGGRTLLLAVNADGTDARVVTGALELRGAPAWAPDGRSITVAAVVDGVPRLLGVPEDGGAPTPLVAEHSVDPAWSPAGDVVAFSGADVGTTFPVRAVGADGSARPTAELRLTRGARRLCFMPAGRSLVVLRGEIRHKDLWVVDLDGGADRRLTDLPPGFDVVDFDLSADGREMVLEQAQEQSNVVLIERPPR